MFLLQFNSSAVSWRNSSYNPESRDFIKAAERMERILNGAFNDSSGVISWDVFKLSKWYDYPVSPVRFSVHVETTVSWTAEQLANTLLDAVENGKIRSNMMSNITVDELDSNSGGLASSTFKALLTITPVSTEASALLTPSTDSLSVSTTPQMTVVSTESTLPAIWAISTDLPVSKLLISTTREMFTPSSNSSPISTTPQMSEVSADSTFQVKTSVSTTTHTSISPTTASKGIPPTDELATRTPTIPAEAKTFIVSMKVNAYKYHPEMANPESNIFKETAQEIEKELYLVICLKKLRDCIAIKVFKLEQGSVIVSYNVYMASSTKYKRSDVQTVISDTAKDGELQHMQVHDVSVKEEKEEKSGDQTSSSPFVYILYGAGALLVIAIIVLVFVKVRKWRVSYLSKKCEKCSKIPTWEKQCHSGL